MPSRQQSTYIPVPITIQSSCSSYKRTPPSRPAIVYNKRCACWPEPSRRPLTKGLPTCRARWLTISRTSKPTSCKLCPHLPPLHTCHHQRGQARSHAGGLPPYWFDRGIIRDNVWSEATQPQTPKTSAKARRRARLYSQKVFRRRPSVLSVMLRDKDFQTIYNIAVTYAAATSCMCMVCGLRRHMYTHNAELLGVCGAAASGVSSGWASMCCSRSMWTASRLLTFPSLHGTTLSTHLSLPLPRACPFALQSLHT